MDDNPIVFIDDDEDDHLLVKQALAEIGSTHPLVVFTQAQDALAYLQSDTQLPFLVISEISLPGMNGLELREQIEKDPALRRKSIPFIFMTSPVEDHLVEQAYELTIQGLFEKQREYKRVKSQLQSIINYWTECLHPKRFDD